jgi:hypothetical protein
VSFKTQARRRPNTCRTCGATTNKGNPYCSLCAPVGGTTEHRDKSADLRPSMPDDTPHAQRERLRQSLAALPRVDHNGHPVAPQTNRKDTR